MIKCVSKCKNLLVLKIERIGLKKKQKHVMEMLFKSKKKLNILYFTNYLFNEN